jgi:hypothetical protein
MDSNKIGGRHGAAKMDFETAAAFVLEHFFTSHPKASLPEWFADCATLGGTKDAQMRWILNFTVVPKLQLQADEFWEERNGKSVLAKLDPKTGQKRIVIHRKANEVVVIFQAIVDPETGQVTVLIDSDLSAMDGSIYERVA